MIGGLNTTAVRTALMESRGDMIEAAASLSCRAWDIAEAVRADDDLRTLMGAIREERSRNSSWDAMTTEEFSYSVTAKLAVYRAEALEEIRKIATMEVGDNAEMNKVKLAAAVKLFGEAPITRQDAGLAEIMQEIAKRYQEAAPRLARLRVQMDFSPHGEAPALEERHPLLVDTAPSDPLCESASLVRQESLDGSAVPRQGRQARARKSKSSGD